MTVPSSTPISRGRSPLPLVLGGCAVLALCACALFAGAAGAGYWSYTQRTPGAARAPAADVVRAELESLPAGEASGGAQVFNGVGGCSACHSLDPDVRIVGPSLSGVASRAATRKPDYSAEMYLYESIVTPNAYGVEGFLGGIMPANFKQQLSEQQLADLVAFLMTQGER